MRTLHIYIANDDSKDIRESLHRLLITSSSAVDLFDNRKIREQAYSTLSKWEWYKLPNQAIAASGPLNTLACLSDWVEQFYDRDVIAVIEDDETGYEVICNTKEITFKTESMKLHDLILKQFPRIFARYLTERSTLVISSEGYTQQSEFITAVRGDCLRRLQADIGAVLGRNIIRASSDKTLSCVHYSDAYGYETVLSDEKVFSIRYNKTAELLIFPEVQAAIPYFVANAERHIVLSKFRDLYIPIFNNMLYSMFNEFILLV